MPFPMPTSQNHRVAAEINAAAHDILVYDDESFAIDLTEAAFTILNKLRTLPTVSYVDALREATGLLEPSEVNANPEYLRGMCELAARLFGDSVMGSEGDTDAGRQTFENDVRAVLAGHV